MPIRPEPDAARDLLLSHYLVGDHVFQWHMDTFDLLTGAELLVTGDDVRHQAYRPGDRTGACSTTSRSTRTRSTCGSTRSPSRGTCSPTGEIVDQVLAEADRHSPHTEKGAEVFRRFATVTEDIAQSGAPTLAADELLPAADRRRRVPPRERPVARRPDGGYGVPALHIDAVRRAGGRTAIVLARRAR